MRLILGLTLATLSLLSCKEDVKTTNNIFDNQWQLSAYGFEVEEKKAVLEGVNYTLVFDENNKVTGNMDCNAFSSSYEINTNEIKINAIATTRMACALMGEEGYNQQQNFINNAYKGVATYSISGTQLTLTSVDRSQLIFDAIQN